MENEIEAKTVAEQVTSSHREQRLVLGSSGQEPEQEQCGITHYAGCACHEKGWENKWKVAIEMSARAQIECERLRDALQEIIGCGLNCKDSLDEAEQMERIAKEALSENADVHGPRP